MKCKYKESCGYEVCMMEECSDFEEAPMTNGDRIREMSDEELAELFSGMCHNAESCDICPMDGSCGGSGQSFWWERWLRQPAEEAAQ